MKSVTWITKDKGRACSSYICIRMKSEIVLTNVMVGLFVNVSWTLFKREVTYVPTLNLTVYKVFFLVEAYLFLRRHS